MSSGPVPCLGTQYPLCKDLDIVDPLKCSLNERMMDKIRLDTLKQHKVLFKKCTFKHTL